MNEPRDLNGALADNIHRLAERQRRVEAEAPWSDRLAGRITAFTGSMTFVALHLTFFGGWIVWNLWLSPKFDPTFVVLAMIASVEAIFLSTFVLISQNRMAAQAQARADLDLHINLLAEHELSRLTALVRRIAERVGVEPPEDTAEIERDVRAEDVLDTLDRVTPAPPGA
ncbi:DUF1003 domain-containing protein [Sphingomonas sp. RRHST34]|uniref:DUF1003 domain-containing protein n=1 Tax=Sphingomonas citri TaxID=2862499 RepID=A0ABS7BQX8_9SPHN|nr:DUF1003 domain-containing protein [Sphingomonas citri]MBW6532007.1 DUF1003 domain-containing protein [Sphingomonas citri]